MPRNSFGSSGFTLVELAVTLTVLGLLLAFSIPAFNRINQTYQLQSATQNVAGTMRLWRERSIARGTEHQVDFNTFIAGTNWHAHEYTAGTNTEIGLYPGGRFASGITYYTVGSFPRFTKDGRVMSGSGVIVLQNQRGARDTIHILTSGLILD